VLPPPEPLRDGPSPVDGADDTAVGLRQ
jgi:hypothetical protein